MCVAQFSSFSSDLFALVTMCFSVEIPTLLFSCKWTHVREPSRTGHVCRGQSNVVHLWAGHRGGHPRCLFRGEHLQEAEHNAGHHQPVPSHHDYCRHAAKHSWLVLLNTHTHTHTHTHSATTQKPHPFPSNTLSGLICIFAKITLSPRECFPVTRRLLSQENINN